MSLANLFSIINHISIPSIVFLLSLFTVQLCENRIGTEKAASSVLYEGGFVYSYNLSSHKPSVEHLKKCSGMYSCSSDICEVGKTSNKWAMLAGISPTCSESLNLSVLEGYTSYMGLSVAIYIVSVVYLTTSIMYAIAKIKCAPSRKHIVSRLESAKYGAVLAVGIASAILPLTTETLIRNIHNQTSDYPLYENRSVSNALLICSLTVCIIAETTHTWFDSRRNKEYVGIHLDERNL